MRSRTRWALVAGALVVSATAAALPWDVDMADSQTVKAYERPMVAPPEHSVAQPNLLTPRHPSANNLQRFTPQSAALVSPLDPADAKVQALGGQMYGMYCWPCHGDAQGVGPVGQPGRLPGVIPWSALQPTAQGRAPGDVYLTVRNGGVIMPSYGWTLSDEEMWAVTAYVRGGQ